MFLMSENRECLINSEFVSRVHIEETSEKYSIIVSVSDNTSYTLRSLLYNENNKKPVKEEAKEYLRNLANQINNKMYKV